MVKTRGLKVVCEVSVVERRKGPWQVDERVRVTHTGHCHLLTHRETNSLQRHFLQRAARHLCIFEVSAGQMDREKITPTSGSLHASQLAADMRQAELAKDRHTGHRKVRKRQFDSKRFDIRAQGQANQARAQCQHSKFRSSSRTLSCP